MRGRGDCILNQVWIISEFRVIKTTKQTHESNISYGKAINNVIEKDGVKGLFFRGLKTRILANGLQSSMFAIAWKYIEKLFREC